MPLATTGAGSLLVTWLAAAAVSSGLWLALIRAAGALLAPAWPALEMRLDGGGGVVFGFGLLLFVLAAALHYLMLAVERSREAETRGLALQVLAREAELKALRTQIDPHFLFNSLNSISALTTADPAGARRMCLLLGEFLRLSLKLGARDRIPLAEELSLVERFLDIEQVRFGDRLGARVTLDPAAARCEVPALLLQPVVENAVRHGIAELVEGGVVAVQADRHGDRVSLTIENPCDASRRGRAGAGVGLRNVRARLSAAFGATARLEIAERGGRYRVEVTLPALEAEPESAPARVAGSAAPEATS